MACITGSRFSLNVNGELHGFFPVTARGLRQGDPISPYLFTLVMEIFTLIMKRQVSENGEFKYHWGCKEVKLTHMCFADDLLKMCAGNVQSVQVIKAAMEELSGVSGLYPNLSKSTVFFGSVQEDIQQESLQVIGFVKGKLPVRFLGVPLSSKKLGLNECKSLIVK